MPDQVRHDELIRASLSQQFGVLMGVRRGTATQDPEFFVARIFDPVRRARWDAQGVAGADHKGFIPHGHSSLTGNDVVKLFTPMMPMQLRRCADRHNCLRQTLVGIAMCIRMHQLTDGGPVLGDIRLDLGVAGFLHLKQVQR